MRLAKSVFATMLAIVLAIGTLLPTFAADDPTIVVDLVDAKPGESVELGISVLNNPGIISMLLNVKYDQNLKLVKVENEEFLKDSFHDTQNVESNPYVLSWGDDTAIQNTTKNGKVVTLTFEVSETAPTGKLPVQVLYDNKDAAIYNVDLNTVDFLVENGGVNVVGKTVDYVDTQKPEKPTDKPIKDEDPTEETKPQAPDLEEMDFADVKNDDWFFANVAKAVELGLMNGVAEKKFAPNDALTRGMFVTVLHRMSDEPIVNFAMNFDDVKADEYYAEAVRWAASEKIVNGVSDTKFAPDDKITREQMATMLYRYANAMGIDVSISEGANILSFKDADKISEYAVEAIKWIYESKIMQGNADGAFAPLSNATRAELATVLVRTVEILR